MRSRVRHDLDGDGRDVRARHRRQPSVTGRPADHPVLPRHQRREVEVEVVAEEGVAQAALPDVLLGGPVVAAEGERAVGSGRDERRVDDLQDARLGRGVHEAAVLVEPVG